jgi:hypothetical protein
VRKQISILIAISLSSLLSGHVLAQAEKITINNAPKPNQKFRFTMAMETDFDISIEHPDLPAALKPMKMGTKIVMGMSQKTGAFNKQGQLEAELTFEKLSLDFSMNGTPSTGGELDKIIGKKIIVIYNSKRELADINASDIPGVSIDSLTQMLSSLYEYLPEKPISVGETENLPLTLDFPLTEITPEALKIRGELKTKLITVEMGADGRIANFETTEEAKILQPIESSLPAGKSKMEIEVKVKGSGKYRYNLDNELPRDGESIHIFEGKLIEPSPTGERQSPGISIKGTRKISFSITNLARKR